MSIVQSLHDIMLSAHRITPGAHFVMLSDSEESRYLEARAFATAQVDSSGLFYIDKGSI